MIQQKLKIVVVVVVAVAVAVAALLIRGIIHYALCKFTTYLLIYLLTLLQVSSYTEAVQPERRVRR